MSAARKPPVVRAVLIPPSRRTRVERGPLWRVDCPFCSEQHIHSPIAGPAPLIAAEAGMT